MCGGCLEVQVSTLKHHVAVSDDGDSMVTSECHSTVHFNRQQDTPSVPGVRRCLGHGTKPTYSSFGTFRYIDIVIAKYDYDNSPNHEVESKCRSLHH